MKTKDKSTKKLATALLVQNKLKVPKIVQTDIDKLNVLFNGFSPTSDELFSLSQDIDSYMRHDQAWSDILEVYRDVRDAARSIGSVSRLNDADYAHMAHVYLIGYVVGMNQRKLTFHTVEVE